MMPMRPANLIEILEPPDATDAKKKPAQAALPVPSVLDAYTDALRTFRTEPHAFDIAVAAYRAGNPDVSASMARQAVANIICHKP